MKSQIILLFLSFSEDLLPASNVKIFLYDTYGKLLNQIEDRPYVNGYHLVKMDVSTLASGFYFTLLLPGINCIQRR